MSRRTHPSAPLAFRQNAPRVTLLLALLTAASSVLAQAEREPNDNQVTADTILAATEVTGQVAIREDVDWFVTELPDDGTVRVFVEYTTRGQRLSAALRTYNADGAEIAGTTARVGEGATSFDTLEVTCRAEDVFFFRLTGTSTIDYTFRYELTPPAEPRDPEPNDDLASATPLALGATVEGRVGYVDARNTRATVDYYRAVLPDDGTVRAYVDYTNYSETGSADAVLRAYDETGRELAGFRGNNGANVPIGATVTDTVSVFCRARDTIFLRVEANRCFGYRLRYELEAAPYADDREPNDIRAEATPISVAEPFEGRLRYVDGRGQSEGSDYYTFERDDITDLRLTVEHFNGFERFGSDLTVAIYNSDGRRVYIREITDPPLGYGRTVLDARCLPPGRLYVQLSSRGCFAYRVSLRERSANPIADITTARYGRRFAFDAGARPDATLSWDFGDGTESTDRRPTHTYGVGSFAATVTARTRGCGFVARDTVRVQVAGIEAYRPMRAGRGGPVGPFSIQVFGGDLLEGTTVTLSRDGETVTPVRLSLGGEGAEATAYFNFRQVGLGAYDLNVVTATGERFDFPGGFTVYADPNDLQLSVDLVGPSRARTGRYQNYSLEVTNASDRAANGVYVGFVTPRSFETDLDTALYRRRGVVDVRGAAWDRLAINRADFAREYFQDDFDPLADGFTVDMDRFQAYSDRLVSFELDSLFDEPFRGIGHLVYVPIVRSQSTARIDFKMRGTASGTGTFAAYVLPYTARYNPLTPAQMDFLHDGGVATLSSFEYAPNPALRALGRATGFIDLGSQALFQVAADIEFGSISTDVYKDIALNAGFEYAGSKLPFQNRADAYEAAAETSRRHMRRGQASLELLQETVINSGGRLSPGMGRRLAGEIEASKLYLESLGDGLDVALKEQAVARLRDKFSKLGLKLTKERIEQLLEGDADDGDDRDRKTNEPKEIKRPRIRTANSFDPNAIYGPDGFGESRYVRRDDALGYEVTYENVDTAEIAAQVVRVELTLDPEVYDLGRTTLGGIHIGGRRFGMPAGRTELFRDVDLRPAQPYLVRVIARLDTLSGEMTWTFQTLDPETMDVPADPFAGFLPPNVNPPEGDGGLTFTTFLREGLTTGDTARLGAEIFFDENDPISTGDWVNTVDETAPVSGFDPVAELTTDSTIALTYGGTDRGAGIERYYVYVRKDDFDWLSEPLPIASGGVATVTIDPAARYAFYLVAQDSVGLRENKPQRAEVTYEAGAVVVGTTDPLAAGTARMTLHPNPGAPAENSFLTVAGYTGGGGTMEVFDALGHRVRASAVEFSAAGTAPVPSRGLAAGVYVVRLRDDGGAAVGSARLVVR